MKQRKIITLLFVSAIGALIACSAEVSGTTRPSTPTFSAPIPVGIGQTIGAPTFAAGDSSAGGQGQTVNGVACDTLPPVVHVHAHLTLIADSVQRAIPLAIGTVDPFIVQHFVVAARCFYWLHTHDATGFIHREAPVTTPLTLGDFFAIWGEPLSRSNIAGFQGTVTAYIDSTRYDGNLSTITIEAHKQITLIVGGVPAVIPIYQFPAAY